MGPQIQVGYPVAPLRRDYPVVDADVVNQAGEETVRFEVLSAADVQVAGAVGQTDVCVFGDKNVVHIEPTTGAIPGEYRL